MGTEIFYFSGTGNSLAAARDIAEKIGGKLVPVPAVMHLDRVKSDADAIGIVFPVYNQGVPLIIQRLIDRMDELKAKYIFGVCTCGNNPGISLEYLDKMLAANGGSLAAGFAVKMPYNYMNPAPVLKDFFSSFVLGEVTVEKQHKMFDDWKAKCEYVCQYIQERKDGEIEAAAKTIEYLVDFLNLRNTLQRAAWLKVAGFKGHTDLPFSESIQLMDHGFICGDECNSCGTCAKICPVEDIEMIEGRPVWQHHCEQCFACLHWCPREAIQFGNGTLHRKRYHHPEVDLSDMVYQRDCP